MTISPLRVLHVIASLSRVHGGTTSSVLQIMAGLNAQGVICEVATSDDDGPGLRLATDASERRLPGRHYFKKHADVYTYTPAMKPWLERHVHDYDVVHIHGLFSYVNGLAGRICWRQNVPYIITPHGMANRYGMRHKRFMKKASLLFVERPLLQNAAQIHLTSGSEERDFEELNIGTPLVRIPLPVAPVPQGKPNTFRVRHPEIRDQFVAVFVGRLNPIKNIEAAIDALALPDGDGFHLVICGDGPKDYLRSLKIRATTRGVANRVSWLGFVDNSDKADVLAAGDIYVQPSLSESFGMAAIEALSAGLPCVLGEDVAIAEDLVEAGFAIATAPTAEDVASGMVKAVELLQTSHTNFVRQASSFVSTYFDSKTISRKLIEVYNRVEPSITCPNENTQLNDQSMRGITR